MKKKKKKSFFKFLKRKNSKYSPRFNMSIIGIIATGFFGIYALYCATIQSSVKQNTLFQIDQGSSISSVANVLKNNGLIQSENLFKAMILVFSGDVKKGNYDLPKGASTWRLARMMSGGDIASTTVLIREGLTVKQIIQVLNENKNLTGSACDDMDTVDKVGDVAIGVIMPCPKDGELFPDTYRVAKGTARASVIHLMKSKMDEIKLGWERSGKPSPKPLTDWNQVITLASIVQKETPRTAEMPIVASVYFNRLRRGMKLQADPTVVYAITDKLGDMRGKTLWSKFLKIKNPYNTYTNYGLPPAPIANVGRDAIAAVLAPADTNYLFFVADGQGGHNFSHDFDEHNKNRAKWRLIKAEMNK